jgi:methionine-gamma-lyase
MYKQAHFERRTKKPECVLRSSTMKEKKASHTRWRKDTKAIHAGGREKTIYGEVSVPIFQSSTFAFPDVDEGAARFAGKSKGYIYTRLGNPTVDALEENVAALENGFRGIATSTGMAAISAVFFTLLSRQAHVVATDAIYGASRLLLESEFSRYGVTSTFVDSSRLENIRGAMRSETQILYIETPTNPTMTITDIRGAADAAHEQGALLVVDNTFASPYLQRPFEHGADIVVHSLTKFINGHTDVVGGMIVTATEDLYTRIRKVVSLTGGTMDPHQAWLVLRGARTLPLRLERAQQNAGKLAEFLDNHPNVTWVRYPGLPSHPQHELARRQMDGFGSMISFGVRNGLKGGIALLNNLRLVTLAVSLGGIESLIEHPASMTHASVPRDEREQAGILDELVRFSVGCENLEDLKDDLSQALDKI